MNEDARFRNAVDQSWDAVFAVARYIHRLGDWEVLIQPYRLRPSFERRDGYGDQSDLMARKHNSWRYVEVKWKHTLEFTSRDDFPYPTILLDRPEKGHAHSYFTCNRALTHAAIVDFKTRDRWLGPTEYFDKTKGYRGYAYECPVELAKFVALNGGME